VSAAARRGDDEHNVGLGARGERGSSNERHSFPSAGITQFRFRGRWQGVRHPLSPVTPELPQPSYCRTNTVTKWTMTDKRAVCRLLASSTVGPEKCRTLPVCVCLLSLRASKGQAHGSARVTPKEAGRSLIREGYFGHASAMLVPIYGRFQVHVHPRVSNDLLMCVGSSRRIQLGLAVSWISDVPCDYQLFLKWFVPHQQARSLLDSGSLATTGIAGNGGCCSLALEGVDETFR